MMCYDIGNSVKTERFKNENSDNRYLGTAIGRHRRLVFSFRPRQTGGLA